MRNRPILRAPGMSLFLENPVRLLCGVTSEEKREYGEVGLDAEHGEIPGTGVH